MLRIHVFSFFIIKTPLALNREDTDTCNYDIKYILNY